MQIQHLPAYGLRPIDKPQARVYLLLQALKSNVANMFFEGEYISKAMDVGPLHDRDMVMEIHAALGEKLEERGADIVQGLTNRQLETDKVNREVIDYVVSGIDWKAGKWRTLAIAKRAADAARELEVVRSDAAAAGRDLEEEKAAALAVLDAQHVTFDLAIRRSPVRG